MKVLCISGKARSGKDTVGDIFKEILTKNNYKVLVIHYADLLKWICTKFFGWNGVKDLAGRSLIQYVGTDIVRNQDPDYWVNFVIGFLRMFNDEWDYAIIPDCRFPNEIELIKQNFDAYSIRIERPNFDNNLSVEQKAHLSETSLDSYSFDYRIINDKSIDDLKNHCDRILRSLNIRNISINDILFTIFKHKEFHNEISFKCLYSIIQHIIDRLNSASNFSGVSYFIAVPDNINRLYDFIKSQKYFYDYFNIYDDIVNMDFKITLASDAYEYFNKYVPDKFINEYVISFIKEREDKKIW